jgi:hypothetical protein
LRSSDSREEQRREERERKRDGSGEVHELNSLKHH